MTDLVTGATGFLGSALARLLRAEGRAVRALARPGSDRRNLEATGDVTGEAELEIAEGDLTDRASVDRAVDGCENVFHVGALYRLWHPRPAAIYAANLEGTRNVLAASLRAGVRRVVHTSSVATLGIPADGTPGDEETPVSLADMVGPYKRSKFLAEELARDYAYNRGLDVVVVNPTAPIGPFDRKPTPTGRMVLDCAAGKTPAYVETGLNVVHVDDAARGHLLALERGSIGERYVLGGENMTLLAILTEVARISGQKPPRLRIRPGWVLPVAYLSQGWARLTGGEEPRVTVDGLRLSRKTMFFSDAKARRELGHESRPAVEALRDAVAWFRAQGFLG